MYATITAPQGKGAEARRILTAAGIKPDTKGHIAASRSDVPATAKPVINDLYRRGWLTIPSYSCVSHAEQQRRQARDAQRLLPLGPLAEAIRRFPQSVLERAAACSPSTYRCQAWGLYTLPPSEAKRELERRQAGVRGITYRGESHLAEVLAGIGPAGEQALSDESRYFDTWNERPSSKRVNVAEIDTVDVNADGSAALITRHIYTLYNSRLRSSEIEVYLVVRDATSGERHILRVPPKFGKRSSVTRTSAIEQGGPAALVQAAIAWTFGLKPGEYAPQVQA